MKHWKTTAQRKKTDRVISKAKRLGMTENKELNDERDSYRNLVERQKKQGLVGLGTARRGKAG